MPDNADRRLADKAMMTYGLNDRRWWIIYNRSKFTTGKIVKKTLFEAIQLYGNVVL